MLQEAGAESGIQTERVVQHKHLAITADPGTDSDGRYTYGTRHLLRQRGWHSSESIKMIQELMENRMYPLTLDGLDSAMRELSK